MQIVYVLQKDIDLKKKKKGKANKIMEFVSIKRVVKIYIQLEAALFSGITIQSHCRQILAHQIALFWLVEEKLPACNSVTCVKVTSYNPWRRESARIRQSAEQIPAGLLGREGSSRQLWLPPEALFVIQTRPRSLVYRLTPRPHLAPIPIHALTLNLPLANVTAKNKRKQQHTHTPF